MSREKELHGCIPSLRVLLEGSSALWVHKVYMLGAWSQWGGFRGCLGMSSVTPVAELHQTNWSSGLSAGPGSLEGGDGASEPRLSGWK